ncbi:hypothetical protein CRX72_01385 [Pantoea sp. BRM17]|nr:hypothetical protein CRX72_01385 [Pantoea sp. BRM17]
MRSALILSGALLRPTSNWSGQAAGLVCVSHALTRQESISEEELRQRLARMGTIDLRVDYLRPGRGERFIATGTLLRAGNKVAVARVELTQQDARQLIGEIFVYHMPFNQALGLELEHLDADTVRLAFANKTMLVGNAAQQILHGGVIASVLDVAYCLRIVFSSALRGKVFRAVVQKAGHSTRKAGR